jgi:hypothetical protein
LLLLQMIEAARTAPLIDLAGSDGRSRFGNTAVTTSFRCNVLTIQRFTWRQPDLSRKRALLEESFRDDAGG